MDRRLRWVARTWVARTSGACSGRRGPSDRCEIAGCYASNARPEAGRTRLGESGYPNPADFNAANGIGIQDIFDFLAAWFAGCGG